MAMPSRGMKGDLEDERMPIYFNLYKEDRYNSEEDLPTYRYAWM